MSEEKTRVAFDFTPEAIVALDELVKTTKSASRAEIVRKALKLYRYWHNKTKNEGYTLVFERDDERQGIEVLL